jgi:hypothetical protein
VRAGRQRVIVKRQDIPEAAEWTIGPSALLSPASAIVSPHMRAIPSGALTVCLAAWLLAGCTSLLPRSKEHSPSSPWITYREAQAAFDQIVPGKTTLADLAELSLDPDKVPNIAILNYSDVLRRFMLNSLTLADLDHGVQECVMAKTVCRGLEINQRLVSKQRNGSFWLDLLGFRRETQTQGWRFSGLVLLKDGVVVYKLTGGQPVIHDSEESANPLGPVQSIGSKLLGGWL